MPVRAMSAIDGKTMPSVWYVAQMEAASVSKATKMMSTFAAVDKTVGHPLIFNWDTHSLGD